MALPSPLYTMLESGIQAKVLLSFKQTRKPIIIYDRETFRDTPSVIPGGAGGAIGSPTGGDASMQISGGINPSVNAVIGAAHTDYVYVTASGGSSVLQEDAYTHIPKRYIPKLDTLIEFWDSDTVGLAMTALSVTTVANSGVITVADAQLLTPGQVITAVGIPVGAIITSILSESAGVITKTTATISAFATASATVIATLTGGNKVGECMQTEFEAWAAELSTPQ